MDRHCRRVAGSQILWQRAGQTATRQGVAQICSPRERLTVCRPFANNRAGILMGQFFEERTTMSGPIVRTGTTPKFWQNWDQVFGNKSGKKSGSSTKAASKSTKSAKKASTKSAAGKKAKKPAGKKK
jgi:hypothetical protein